MNKNTGDGELKKILIDYLGTAWRAYEDGLIDPAPLSKAKTAIKEYAAQEANKAVKRYQELQHEELTNELIQTEREAQQNLLQELMEQSETIDVGSTGVLEYVPIEVIQNKLEGLS